MSYVADTSFVISVFNKSDKNHVLSREVYSVLNESLLLPSVALTECAFFFERMGGSRGVARALDAIEQSYIDIVEPEAEDYRRISAILNKYADSRIDFVDACIMAIAERLKITSILTYDRRDFGLYRPTHCEYFTLLPE